MRSLPKILVLTVLILVISSLLAAESKGWQLVQSLAVPGLSQVRAGRNYGYAMLAAEAGIISTLLYLNAEKVLKTQEYYEYALKYAHIQPGDYPDQYWRDLSRYSSSGYDAGGYNAGVLQDAVQLYPNDPVLQQAYIDANIYTDAYAWNWDSVDNRAAYSKVRIRTQDLRDYASMTVGVLIVNHLISGIDVLRFVSEKSGSQVYMDVKDKSPMLMLKVDW
ncbi:MAG: hypothetical protein K0B87_01330 [Candidatus Syntrophosphaera sp.]|nr:hypothetical protein [Candidatus Syntrophosphaera sp.]